MRPIGLARGRPRAWLLVLFGGVVLGANAGCEKAPSQPSAPVERPRRFLQEIPFPGGTGWLHTCGGNLAAVSRKRDVYVWEWNELDKPPRICKDEGQGGAAAFMLPEFVLTETSTLVDPDPSHPVLLKNLGSGAELRRWAFGPALFCYEMRTSRNGRFVAFRAKANGIPTVHVGLLDPGSEEPLWVAQFEQKRGTLMASHVAPSEDGRCIAVVGLHDGAWIAVADVQTKQVLWSKTQKGAVQFYDVAFSPDSTTVYAGGTCGGLFGYDVAKGEVTGRWLMGEGMDMEYGYRITRVAASPDGRLVAAGTGSDGDVYLWNAKTGGREAVLQTRQATIMGLAFSPDSKRLAVTGVRNRTIEIWDVAPGRASP